ncbi:MAG TPA: AAA family ATPase, partial [Gemmatimonadaceae bacterium]|nr:AAA family ATPase [Gemmatimonadaceae bacterium]
MPSSRTQQALARLADLTPRQIASELDRYIVGQAEAKKAVAIALRNRWRRQRAPESIREEISPNNIILIGPTGVGKTEIARRLAKLAGAPFIKVEASKFTEVGYVGRDVESMVRDLVESAIDMVRSERESEVEDLAHERVDERLLDLLLPPPEAGAQKVETAPAPRDTPPDAHDGLGSPSRTDEDALGVFLVSGSGAVVKEKVDPAQERYKRTRDKLRQLLLDGKLEDRELEVEVPQNAPMFDVLASQGAPEGMDNISDMLKE